MNRVGKCISEHVCRLDIIELSEFLLIFWVADVSCLLQ